MHLRVLYNKMKNKIYYTVSTVSKYNCKNHWNIGKINTNIYTMYITPVPCDFIENRNYS